MTETNNPTVLVEFSAEEVTWLADRLHEYRGQLTAAVVLGSSLFREGAEPTDKVKQALEVVEGHKRMEAMIRNRILNKAAEQGFGDL